MNIDFAGASGGHTHFRLILDLSQSISGNYTDLSFAGLQGYDSSADARPIYFGITITVAGTTVYKINFVGMNSSNGILYNNRSSFTNCHLGSSGPVTGSVRIPHDADGRKTVAATCTGWLQQDQGYKWYFSPVTVYVTLPAIPRVSGISATGTALESDMKILLQRAAAGFTDTVSWTCGTASGIIADQTTRTELFWKPPLELAVQAPNSIYVPITLTVTTYQSGQQIGQGSTLVYCTIPNSIVPTVQVQVRDFMGYREIFGSYIQNQSRLQVTASGQGILGSTCREVQIRFGGMTSSLWKPTFAIANAGTQSIEVQVTDSRGRIGTWTGSVEASAYRNPQIGASACFRCSSDGTEDPAGSYAKVLFSGEVTPLENLNTAAYALHRRIRGTEDWTSIPITDYDGMRHVQDGYFLFPASVDQAYEYRLILQDRFTVSESPMHTLQAAFALMDFDRAQKGVGILQRASKPNTLSIGADTKHYGHRITDIADPVDDQDAVTFGWIRSRLYPVGSIYLSVSDVSPEIIFGGSWERIEDRFLLAAGDSYEAGSEGGEAEHTLTLAEMPEHAHTTSANATFTVGNAGGTGISGIPQASGWGSYTQADWYRISIGKNGGNGAHNNMPPYLAVYMWIRIA